MDAKIYQSQDGSHTLISKEFDVSYHSKYGAIEESRVVFIDAGLHYLNSKGLSEITIFELGFGTGLNPLLTMIEADTLEWNVSYTGIEAYPIDLETANQLNYPEILEGDYVKKFKLMHGQDKMRNIENLQVSPHFSFNKIIDKFEDFTFSKDFDLIYFDAFAPSSQPELWNEDVLLKCFEALNPGGVLVTYCAKGVFKRALKSVGFTVENLPGPTGKREITRAIKMG
jgi:tRNA U34 5-methylaminomethyl-2-thiouridine-forming methyltransferase MnmC